MRLFYWLVICCLLALMTSPVSAQMRIDSYQAIFKNIPINDVPTHVQHSNWHRGEGLYFYQSNDSGESFSFGDTISRVDVVILPFIFNDRSQVEKPYYQDLSFVIDSSVNRIRNFYLYVGFSYDEGGWYSNQTITIDSIDLKRTPSGYHAYIDDSQLLKAHFDFHRYKGNISQSIAGWIATLDSNNLRRGSVELFINGSLPLAVKKVKSEEAITIVPNPAFGIVSISVPKQQTSIQIYDMLGREIPVQPLGADKTLRFNSASLACGIYWVRCGALVEKLIVSGK